MDDRIERLMYALRQQQIVSTKSLNVLRVLAYAGMLAGCSLRGQSAQNVSLVWDANSEVNLAGYNLYYGPATRTYTNVINVGNVTTNTVSNLLAGSMYHFAVTAYDTSGLESDFSNEIIYTSTNQVKGPQIAITSIAAAQPLTLMPRSKPMTLQWSSTAGTIYHVLGKNVLTARGWTDLSGPVIGLGGTTSWTDTTAAGSPSRFYCVRSAQ